MIYIQRRFYEQVTYSAQKQAYVFVENDAIVTIENSMCAMYHDPTKKSFKYDQKMKQFQHISTHDHELTVIPL